MLFGTAPAEATRYDACMAIERDDIEERQARIDVMVAEFHAARQRRLVKQGMVLWNRTKAHARALAGTPTAILPPSKVN